MTSAPGLNLNRRDVVLVIALFAASTALYALLGIRFDADNLVRGMQFVDAVLLEDRLFESLWYYHATPPLTNLLAGVGLKLFGEHAGIFYSICFHVLGLLLGQCVYALTLRLSASRLAAATTAGLLMFSPSFVLYENWMFYDFPAMALLTFAAFALHNALRTQKMSWHITFFALLAALLLTRSLFHLAWMLLVTGLLLAVAWKQRRTIAVAAAVPLLLVALWYGKNAWYFGTFSASSWMGLGLSNITTALVPETELVPLVQQGVLSPWALVSRYDSRNLIFRAGLRPPTGIPVLDLPTKVDLRPNYNYRDIPAIDRIYAADARTVVRRFPTLYAYGMYLSNRMFFSPANGMPYFTEANRQAVRPMERLFNPLLYGVRASPAELPLKRFPHGTLYVNTSIPLIAGWIAVLCFGYMRVRKAVRDVATRAAPDAIVIGFITLTAAYVYGLSTTIELGENYRYRLMVEPLFLVLAVTAIVTAVRAVRLSGTRDVTDSGRRT